VDVSIKDPRKDMLVNVMGTLNLLEAARLKGTKKFIYASSGAAIGEAEPPLHEELLPHPISPYGVSKLSGEYYCLIYANTFNLKTASLRFGNVYGERSHRKKSVIAKFIKQALNGETLEIYGEGDQTRDYIYIEDLISAILNVLSNKISASFPWGEVFHIATYRETTVNELVDNLLPILSNFGYKVVKTTNVSPRKGDVKRNYSDTRKAQTQLNWKPKINLSKGLKKTVSWFIKHTNKKVEIENKSNTKF
jgi:UDP-glucose 4-epimerase